MSVLHLCILYSYQQSAKLMSISPLWMHRVHSIVLMHVYNTDRKSNLEPVIH